MLVDAVLLGNCAYARAEVTAQRVPASTCAPVCSLLRLILLHLSEMPPPIVISHLTLSPVTHSRQPPEALEL